MRLSKYVIMCASPPLFPNAHIHIHTNSHIPLQQTWVQCCAADPTGCEERAQRNGSREVPHAGICTYPLISAPNAPSISLGNYLGWALAIDWLLMAKFDINMQYNFAQIIRKNNTSIGWGTLATTLPRWEESPHTRNLSSNKFCVGGQNQLQE